MSTRPALRYCVVWEPGDWPDSDGWSIMQTPLPLPLALAWMRGRYRVGRPAGYLATVVEVNHRDATVQQARP